MSSLISLMVLILVALLAAHAVYLSYQIQVRLLRILSDKLGVPVTTMENKPAVAKEVPKVVDNRKRISVPVGLGGIGVRPSEMFKKPN